MRFGIYAYVDGFDLHDVADLLLRRLSEMARDLPVVKVIDDRFDKTPDMQPGDLPVWNMGLNFDLGPEGTAAVLDVLHRVKAIAQESGRTFAIGYYDRVSQINEDIGFIASASNYDDIVGILETLAQKD